MIEPVSRVQNYTTQRVGSASGKNAGSSDAAPFSMDQAIAEESAKDEGVYYDHSPKAENNDKKTVPENKDDAIIEKPGPEAPMGAIDTAKLVKGIKEFLSGLWSNLVRIFGNIWDEHDIADTGIEEISEGIYDIEGSALLADVEKELEISFDVDDITTLNGFMTFKLGEVPEGEDEGFAFVYGGYSFTVEEVENRVVKMVRVKKF